MQPLYRNTLLQVVTFLSLLVFAGPMLHGQTGAGAISGTVTDKTGAVVAGTKVTVTNQGTNVSHVVTTDSGGFYSIEGLTVGLYTIDISKPGFKESITSGIQIDPGQRRAENRALEGDWNEGGPTVKRPAADVHRVGSGG